MSDEPVYAFPSTPFEVRFADLDASGHLNHASVLVYLEQARVRYYRDVAGVEIPSGLPAWALVRIEVNYHAPAYFGDRLLLDVRVPWMRGSSAGWEFRLVSEDGERRIADGTGTHVHLDVDSGRASPLPDDVRQRIADLEGIPLRSDGSS